jgi:hypothetical protein
MAEQYKLETTITPVRRNPDGTKDRQAAENPTSYFKEKQ